MPNAGENDTNRKEGRDWVDYTTVIVSALTLIVLALTLKAVEKYTLNVRRGNTLSAQMLATVHGNAKTELRAYSMQQLTTLNYVTPAERAAGYPPLRHMMLDYVIYNSGRTPAMHVVTRLDYKVFDITGQIGGADMGADLPQIFACPDSAEASSGVELTIPGQQGQPGTHKFDPVSDQTLAELNAFPPSKVLVVFGCLNYDDVFKSHHCSTFCGIYMPGAPGNGLKMCSGHRNELDGCSKHTKIGRPN